MVALLIKCFKRKYYDNTLSVFKLVYEKSTTFKTGVSSNLISKLFRFIFLIRLAKINLCTKNPQAIWIENSINLGNYWITNI